MNRFALLDSDNEDETPKTKVVTDKKKPVVTKPDAVATKPATAPKPADNAAQGAKKVDNKGKVENKKAAPAAANGNKATVPGQKTERVVKPKSAPSGEVTVAASAGGDDVDTSGFTGTKRVGDSHAHGKVPRSRFEKRQDENDPKIKPDNRIRGAAHSNAKRHPSKNSEKQEIEGMAKEGEKHPENMEAPVESVTEDVEETSEEVLPPAEPEPVTFSLDEYQRRRDEERAKSTILASSKASRVVDELTGLKIKEGDGLDLGVYTGSTKASKTAKANQRSTAKTVVTDLGFKVDTPEVPREERQRTPGAGGRGGERSGRGNAERSGPRTGGQRNGGYAPKGPRVDISDASAFPSL